VPEWVFIGYLTLSFLSLVGLVFWAQWWRNEKDRSAFGTVKMAARSVLGALLLMIPLFYLVCAGMIPTGKPGIAFMVTNLLVALGWVHLAIFAWATGKTLQERYVILAALFLTVPVLFFMVGVGAMVKFPYSFVLAAWRLWLASLILWLESRRHSRR